MNKLVARWMLATTGIALMLTTVAVDARLHLGPLREGVPDLSWQGLWQSAAYCVGMMAVVAALAGVTRALSPGPQVQPVPRALWPARGFDHACLLLTLAAVLVFGTVLVVSPSAYHQESLEDSLLEYASALFPFLASIMAMSLAWKLRDRRRVPALALLVLVLYAVACFCIGGEEISWFQRVLGFQTPPSMAAANMQGEFNFHNFSTNRFENAYYFMAGFVLLVVLPLWREFGLPFGPLRPLVVLVPRTYMIVIGAMITSYNFDMWDGVPTQVAFWGTVAGLVCYGLRARAPDARWAWLVLAFMFTVQALLIVYGGDTGRLWDHTEYKELMISWALWVHAMDLRDLAK